MVDNVKKVFEILNLTPYEWFKIEGEDDTFYINEELDLLTIDMSIDGYMGNVLTLLRDNKKLTKVHPNKKKLRYLTYKEYMKWYKSRCRTELITCNGHPCTITEYVRAINTIIEENENE